MNFEIIKNRLLNEAKSSPNLLSDLAGLENYIAESYYNRSFIELLQNADDAEASKFKIVKQEEFLLVANNGRVFNEKDLESLCRSASSNKTRGKNIGYRGIGFKSVVGFAKEIHIISGDMEITFSKSKTQKEIPEANNVPLIRIPHLLDNELKKELKTEISNFQLDKYTTIFIFSGITALEIEQEFESFNISSLLFLNNIKEIDLFIDKQITGSIEQRQISECETIKTIKNKEIISSWFITNLHDSSFAFHLSNDKVEKLESSDAFVYNFLPTEDTSGLGVIINGNYNTDPSRKHLIYDSNTIDAINSNSMHFIEVFEKNIKKGRIDIINALIPHNDPRLLQFRNTSFEKILLKNIKNYITIALKGLKLCPNWFNLKDYSNLYPAINTISPQCFDIKGFESFVKYLGATENILSNLIQSINISEISILGCAQLTVEIFKQLISGSIKLDSNISSLNILVANNNRISIVEVKKQNTILDSSFISLLIENGLSESDIKQTLNKYVSGNYCENLFSYSEFEKKSPDKTEKLSWFNTNQEMYPASKTSIDRWRSAEENTLDVLNSNGFKLKDVSKQNIGYDLEGVDPDGNPIQLEIKSIKTIGEKIRLTNNEIAVAQEKKRSYFVAIVRQLNDFLEIAFISNPTEKLLLNRQCVQWIWECSEYEYKPFKFKI